MGLHLLWARLLGWLHDPSAPSLRNAGTEANAWSRSRVLPCHGVPSGRVCFARLCSKYSRAHPPSPRPSSVPATRTRDTGPWCHPTWCVCLRHANANCWEHSWFVKKTSVTSLLQGSFYLTALRITSYVQETAREELVS